MYGFQPSTLADKLLPLAGATTDAAGRLPNIVERRDVFKHLLILSKEKMSAICTRSPPKLYVADFFIFLHVAYTLAPKNANTREPKVGSFQNYV